MDRMALKFATKRDTNSLKVEPSDLEQQEQGQQLARRGKRKQVGTEEKKIAWLSRMPIQNSPPFF